MHRVALATYRDLPLLCDDDRLLLDYLNRRGVQAEAVVWDADDADWGSFDCVVLRSCWDYHLRPSEFAEWVKGLAAAQIPMLNPAPTVLWNMDKAYLQDLDRDGVKVVPTVWLRKWEPADLHSILERHAWGEAVIKPSISATAFKTWRTTLSEAGTHNADLQEMLAGADLLVQPFIKEVAEKGEWSLVFLGGEYSHAVLKRPREGDFRVQEAYGGSARRETPHDELVAQAREVLARSGKQWTYARVDGVEVDGDLVLMELELIEPYLFLGDHPQAAQRFGEAIIRHLISGQGSPPTEG